MINYGEYSIEDLPEYDGISVSGIRVAFHKKDLDGALEFCNGIVQKATNYLCNLWFQCPILILNLLN